MKRLSVFYSNYLVKCFDLETTENNVIIQQSVKECALTVLINSGKTPN